VQTVRLALASGVLQQPVVHQQLKKKYTEPKAKSYLASIIARGWSVAKENRQKKSGEAPLPNSSGILVKRLLRTHLASDLRKHVVGVAANQSDRSNHDYQDYREHHRVLGDVLTALFNPKFTDSFDHCLPPIDDTP